MTDPLAGLRETINRGELKVLTYPADRPCPVKKGQTFKLRSCQIRIEKVRRRLARGKAEWVANFVRIEREDSFFLGVAVVNETRSLQHGDSWSYREEHGYTASRDVLDGGICVPPDYQRQLSREAAIASAAERDRQRSQSERLQLERRLLNARRRGAMNTVVALSGHLETRSRRAA